MPSKLEQLQLQFRQRLKEERLIKIHTDHQQKALSQVSKYSGMHNTTTAQSTMAPAMKSQHVLSQTQPHHSPIKKGSPGVDRSRPLPPIAKEQPARNYSFSSSSSPINGSVELASKMAANSNNLRSKSVDLEARCNPSSRPAPNDSRMTPRNDYAQNGARVPTKNEQTGARMPTRNEQNGSRMPPSRNDYHSPQNGKMPLRNGGKTPGSQETKPNQDVPFESKPNQDLMSKLKQAELQRLKTNSKMREDSSPRNGLSGTVSKPSIEPKKTTRAPITTTPATTRTKPKTQTTTTPKRTGHPASSSRPSPRQQSSTNNAPRKPPGPGQEQCNICGRNFNQDRIEKHVSICKKAAQKKVKVFDATKMRTKGTEAEQFVRKGLPKSDPKPAKKSDWRKKHNEFIEAIRQAKLVQQHLAKGGKVSDLPPPKPSDTSDYVQCPHCSRKFNEAVAERHIPKCKNILSNKKNPLPPRKR